MMILLSLHTLLKHSYLKINKYINKRKLSNAIAMVGIAAVLDSDTKVLKEYKG